MESAGNVSDRANEAAITIQGTVVISAVVAYRLLEIEPDLGVENTRAPAIRRETQLA
jgi:hypothetical protein